jgi:DNA-binding beta-propeller fold protein YncE
MKNLKTVFVIISLLAFFIVLNGCSSKEEPTAATIPPLDYTNLPLTVTDAEPIGSFAFNNDGNILFVAESAAELRLLSRETSTVSVIATGLSGSDLRGITATADYIYIGGASGQIYRVNPSTGASSLFTTISGGGYINCLAIAPETFGSYGGQIIAATSSGIYAVNISTLATVHITSITYVSSIAIGSDGTLYAALHDSDSIVTVTAAGVVTSFVTSNLDGPDGITIDNTNGYLYVTNDGDGWVKRVTISDGTVLNIVTSFSFDHGWAPSRIIYDPAGNRLLVGYEKDGALIITCITL